MKRKTAEGVRKRGKGYDIYYPGPDGVRVDETGYDANGDRITVEREAISLRRRRLDEIRNGTWVHPQSSEAQKARKSGLFADDWANWIAGRKARGVLTVRDDEMNGRLHILDSFRGKRTDEITTAQIRAWLTELRNKIGKRGTKLSNNYVHNIATRLRTFFSEAQHVEKTISVSPFAGIPKHERTRASAQHEIEGSVRFYSRVEIECLISHVEIPLRRRVLYALQFFTGARFGETAGFRWYDYDESGAVIHIQRQYEGRKLKAMFGQTAPARVAPVHSELAAILAEWRRNGWREVYGRAPTATDFIVPGASPTRPANERTAQDGLRVDLARIGVRPCGQTHAFRRAMVTIAEANGAGRQWIERVIHNTQEAYRPSEADREAMRKAIECIPVRRIPNFGVDSPSGVRRGHPCTDRDDHCEAAE